MEIRQRIQSCLGELESRRQTVVAYRDRVQGLISALKANDATPGKLGELFDVLQIVLDNYDEISRSCASMIEGLTDIGEHIDRIEDGRHRILNGVEAILKNLSQLDKIAEEGMPLAVGGGDATGAAAADEKKPKRVLLIRIRPEQKSPSARPAASPGDLLDLDDPVDPATGKPIVH
ncbi:MAG: hypothetical protein HY049_11085 [Acidobacteria bacterium]|nr:hypothetical protein [Acidobacteriota bacterium]